MTDNENKHLFCQNLSRSFIGEHILMSATHTYQMCHWGLGQMLYKFDAQSNLKEGKKGRIAELQSIRYWVPEMQNGLETYGTHIIMSNLVVALGCITQQYLFS